MLERVLAVALVVALAALTYEYVETPFRSGRPARQPAAAPGPGALPRLPRAGRRDQPRRAGCGPATARSDRGDNPAISVAAGAEAEHRGARAGLGQGRPRASSRCPATSTPTSSTCATASPTSAAATTPTTSASCAPAVTSDGDRTLVVIGDSHARAWIPAFDKITESNGWRAYYLVKPQCVAAHVSIASAEDSQPFTDCARVPGLGHRPGRDAAPRPRRGRLLAPGQRRARRQAARSTPSRAWSRCCARATTTCSRSSAPPPTRWCCCATCPRTAATPPPA